MAEDEKPAGETPFWNDVTVKTILRNEVYIGHVVQNKTGTVSYKTTNRSATGNPEWIKVENTHEPLIPQETGRRAADGQPPGKGGSGKSGTVALFGGSATVYGLWIVHAVYARLSQKGFEKEPEYRAYMSATATHRAAKMPVRPNYINPRC